MAGARGTAVQVAFFGCAANFLAAGSARHVAAARCECLEDGIEAFHHGRFSTDHLAISALESPDAAAGAHVTVMNAFCGELSRAANIVDVIGISAVNRSEERRVGKGIR